MDIRLRPLNAQDGNDVYEMLQRIPAEENGFMNPMAGKSVEEFGAWLVRQEASAQKKEIEDGWRVPQAIFWLYAGEKPVGMGKLRYFLTDALRFSGGHIGYAVVPEERGKGYGKQLLRHMLSEAEQRSISPVLVTIHEDNAASIATALSCGGRISDEDDRRVRIWFEK